MKGIAGSGRQETWNAAQTSFLAPSWPVRCLGVLRGKELGTTRPDQLSSPGAEEDAGIMTLAAQHGMGAGKAGDTPCSACSTT